MLYKRFYVLSSLYHYLQSPIVFLKLCENAVGEFDLVLTPRFSVPSYSNAETTYFLNFTEIDGLLNSVTNLLIVD